MSTPHGPRASIPSRLVILAAALFAIICVLVVGHKNSSNLLITLFVLWVFAPFAVLGLLVKAGSRWARSKQLLSQRLGLSICAVSTCIYGVVAFGVPTSKPAFWFLVLPLVSLCLIAVVYLVALRNMTDHDA